ncbi:Swt1 family HEPN domain-containing protein [Oscillatoria laete-virens NRMC-F 0139]|nr:Swt1 family HEPN domain-containing protein [Oscillatoria laete-virens]MDL5055262.1 Swt1 family HEPN domain-containing protein [Oscillatoria laete-virens NRMC-F 0139]
MAMTNQERIRKGLDTLKKGLGPFVEREMKSIKGDQWINEAKRSLGPALKLEVKEGIVEWESAPLLKLMWECWNDVFGQTLGRAERSLVSQLMDVRNKWAHEKSFSSDEAYRALDSMHVLLNAVNASKDAEDLDRQKNEVLRLKFDEQARHEKRKLASVIESAGGAGLKPWREICTPHQDVQSGQYSQAEFAADLWQVYRQEGSKEYKDPVEFYSRTYLTTGLRELLSKSIQRLSGQGGDPVVELQTNFGGGKTHSMLALYHLFSGLKPEELPGVEEILKSLSVPFPSKVKRAVVVGTKLSPGQAQIKDDGTVIRTIWGEIGWQLGGKEGFAMVKQADETSTNPGDAIGKLLRKYAPCVILIDEWVAYARGLHETNDLAGGDFETQFTFAQTLSEEVKAVPGALLVVSIPASTDAGVVSPTAGINDEEVGGVKGRKALHALKNAIGRVETPWRPANAEESFEIVRRRLFQPISLENYKSRDLVVKTFCELYRENHQDFPPECREVEYERKMKAAYPIHPEVFDRLYQDWSGLVRFQRTRGVLRLMASVIHTLWIRDDKNPLIMPAQIPLDAHPVESELTGYLPDGWETVIERDVDGPDSLPRKIEGEKSNLGRFGACRRVARTIFLGSAPIPGASNRGIEDRRIKLGCVQPGESPALFGDALRHMTQSATYLYQDSSRYWYSTQPTVTKLAEDRAAQMKSDMDKVIDEIKARVRDDLRAKGDFLAIHPFPANSGEVPDELDCRLVVLSVEQAYSKEPNNPAVLAAQQILQMRGNSPRLYQNTLVFLGADQARIEELNEAVRYYLAWDSIVNEKGEGGLNLDPRQASQAENQRKNWENAIQGRLAEAYQWLLIPTQPTPLDKITIDANKLTGQESLAIRASKKIKSSSQMVTQYAPTLLRQDLDRPSAPLWRGDHVAIKQIVEDFARYIYLQRVQSPHVLEGAMMEGLKCLTWEIDSFAYAESYDDATKRYRGLRSGHLVTVSHEDAYGLLVKPSVAQSQLDPKNLK